MPAAAPGHIARHGRPAAALGATLAFGVVAASAAHPEDVAAAAGDLAVAAVFVGCGAALWADGRTGDLSGPLMVATGILWLLGDVADGLALLHRGPLVQLLVAAPSGRARGWPERFVVIAGYAHAVVPGAAQDGRVTIALALVLAAVVVARWAAAGGLQRRARALPAVAGVSIALVLGVGATAEAAHAGAVLWSYQAVLIGFAIALFVGLRRGGWAQATLTTLVLDLGDSPRGRSIAGAVARAVGDPSVVLGYRGGDGRYLDERGSPVELPHPDADRAVTFVDAGGAPVAALVHDRAALRAPGLSDSVSAAVRLALENVRLQAELRGRLQELEASRARLLAARDTERRGLEARLHAGVGRRLDVVAHELAGLRGDPEALASALPAELDSTRAELRRFAAGLHPPALEAGGLVVALRELASRAPVPVDVAVDCGGLHGSLEVTAWFVCSEALANVVKHAAATRAAIRVERSDGWVAVTVDDDGRGGADPSAGRGLRGLAARVEASGGRLAIGGRSGGGTRLEARLPVREPT
jgi:signal transduction histidine kinase